MKKIVLSTGIATVLLSCSGAAPTIKKPIAEPIAVNQYMETITAGELKTMLTVIAADDMEGRETGSAGQKKAANYLIEQYKKNGIPYPKGAQNYEQFVPAAFLNAKRNEGLPDSANLWAFIEGTEKPEEIVVVSAHYDHVGIRNGEIYNGADDDGSGTVALLEIAQAFQKAKKEGNGPKRSILFLHVTAEEHGLHGSRYYTENPLFPLQNTVADVNIDMIGRSDAKHAGNSNYIYVIGSDYLSTDLYTVCETVNSQYTQLELDYKYNDRKDPNRFYYRSDHYNFAKHNIPSVFLFSGVHADYHKPTDDVDKIEFEVLAKRTKYAFNIVWEIANRAQRLVVDKTDPESKK